MSSNFAFLARSDPVGLFSMVGLDRAASVDAMNSFVADRTMTADQIEFVELVFRNSPMTG